MKLGRILEAALYAKDLDAAEQFYHGVLGLEIISRVAGRGVSFRCGDAVLLLFDPERTRIPDAGVPPDAGAPPDAGLPPPANPPDAVAPPPDAGSTTSQVAITGVAFSGGTGCASGGAPVGVELGVLLALAWIRRRRR